MHNIANTILRTEVKKQLPFVGGQVPERKRQVPFFKRMMPESFGIMLRKKRIVPKRKR